MIDESAYAGWNRHELVAEVMRLRRMVDAYERQFSDWSWERNPDRAGGAFDEHDREAYERAKQGIFG